MKALSIVLRVCFIERDSTAMSKEIFSDNALREDHVVFCISFDQSGNYDDDMGHYYLLIHIKLL